MTAPCPIELDTRQILDHGHTMLVAMQLLKKDLQSCADCASFSECKILATINTQVTAVVQEISDEWDLTSTISPLP